MNYDSDSSKNLNNYNISLGYAKAVFSGSTGIVLNSGFLGRSMLFLDSRYNLGVFGDLSFRSELSRNKKEGNEYGEVFLRFGYLKRW